MLNLITPDRYTQLFSVLDWQRVGAKAMFRHYLKSDSYLASTIEHCRSVLCTFVTLDVLFPLPPISDPSLLQVLPRARGQHAQGHHGLRLGPLLR